MKLTSNDEALDIEQTLKRIEEIIENGELPPNLGGDLMSQSLEEFHKKLSLKFSELQSKLQK